MIFRRKNFPAFFLFAWGCSFASPPEAMAQFHIPGLGDGSKTPKPATAPPKTTTSPSSPAPVPANEPVTAPFDYYVLSLSWAPGFCTDPANAAANPQECTPGKHTGFVLHGLWPEANTAANPESCQKTKPVSKGVLKIMAPYMPSPSLIQHEWATHGTCSGLTPGDYFTQAIQARVAVQLPVQVTAVDDVLVESPEQIEAQFAGTNPSFPAKAFRTACKDGEFVEIRVCFDKNLKGLECTATAGECTAATERIRPPQ
jgi:ribonuclease T2